MRFNKRLAIATKRVFYGVGQPVYFFCEDKNFNTNGTFDNPELLEKLNSLKGKQSNIEFKTTEKLLSIATPKDEVQGWQCTIGEINYYIEKTLHDGSGETLCILSTNLPCDAIEYRRNSDYGI
ncbi:MAG: hypothetical protein ACPG5R_06815 [Cognaticolwellia aestuarii]